MSEQIKELVLLTSVPTEMQASIITASLEEEGLHCAAVGGFYGRLRCRGAWLGEDHGRQA